MVLLTISLSQLTTIGGQCLVNCHSSYTPTSLVLHSPIDDRGVEIDTPTSNHRLSPPRSQAPRAPSAAGSRPTDSSDNTMAHAAPPPTGRQQHQTDFGPSFQREVPVPPRSYIAPPPLAPYVTAEKRIHPPRIPSWGTGPDPGVARYHSNPHPHRPPPIHNPPRAGTWRRNVDQEQQETHMRSPSFPHRTHAFPRQGGASHHPYHPPSEHSSRPGSAASSSRPQLPPFSSLPHHASMQRSISHGSHHSVISSSSRHEISPIRPSSGESSGEGRMDQYGDQQQPLPKFERKRRTRALMTRPQIAALRDLWRAVSLIKSRLARVLTVQTKFPGNLEREQVGSQIGLTPRQVQVWFQVCLVVSLWTWHVLTSIESTAKGEKRD